MDLPVDRGRELISIDPSISNDVTNGLSCVELTLGLIFQETVNLGGSTVVSADGETVISTVEDQVLAHDGQTDQTEISTGGRMRRSADIDAGEAGAEVSAKVLKSIAGQKRDMIK